MPSRATAKQIACIKALGRQLGLTIEGDATGLDHVLSAATFGRVGHWASLSVIEASQAIERLKREIALYGAVEPALDLRCDVCGKAPFWSLPREGDACPDDSGHLRAVHASTPV